MFPESKMVEVVNLEDDPKSSVSRSEIDQLRKEFKQLKMINLILGIDLVCMTYAILKLGGIL